MALTVKRSDLFPVGSTVKAFAWYPETHTFVRPPGPVLAEAVVASDGSLTFPTVTGRVILWCSTAAAGAVSTITASAESFKAPPEALRERIRERRREAGA
jgi:hypothetical protein